jgi:nitrate/TMAO reductase-like tetraheme cytochrome c subunit
MAIGIFTILAGLVALAAGYFYFFGISPETKRKMENQALKTMGENKMSYMAKGESCHTCHTRHAQTLSGQTLTSSRPNQQTPHL